MTTEMIWSPPKLAKADELSTAEMTEIVAQFRASTGKPGAKRPVPTRAFGKTGLKLPVVSFGAWQFMHQAQLNSKRPMFGFERTHTAMRAVAVGTGALGACGAAAAIARCPEGSSKAVAGALGATVASALGFCAAACAFNAAVVANVQDMLRFAKPLGLLHVETARLYNTSEQVLGRALHGMSADERDGFVYQTKVRPMEDPQEFERTVRLSLRLMGGAPVKLLSFHGINSAKLGKWALRCCAVLERLRDHEGLLTHIGFSTHGDSKVISSMIQSGKFDYVNIHAHFIGAYTAQDNWPVVKEATERGMGVFIISPSFQGGRLHNPSPKLESLTAPLTPAEFHALWLLSQPGVCTISLGVETTAELEAARATVELLPIAGKLLPTIENRLRRAVQEALPSEWQSQWWEGIPTSWDDDCPGHLHILSQLRGFALIKALDMIYYANDMDNNLTWPGDWCAGAPSATLTPQLKSALLARLGEKHRPAKDSRGRSTLSAAAATDALYDLQLMLAKHRETADAEASKAPEPCGAKRMPLATDRAVGQSLVRLAKVIGGYYEDSFLCRWY